VLIRLPPEAFQSLHEGCLAMQPGWRVAQLAQLVQRPRRIASRGGARSGRGCAAPRLGVSRRTPI
jgi:hypothetical protein